LRTAPARGFGLGGGPGLAGELVASAGGRRGGRGAEPADATDLSAYARLVDALREGGYAPGADAFAPALGATASLLDHLGDRATVVFEDTVEIGRAACRERGEDRSSSST